MSSKEYNSLADFFTVPRMFASTFKSLLDKDQDSIEFELNVEGVLNQVFGSLQEYWKELAENPELHSYVSVNFPDSITVQVKLEVLDRLMDLGYFVANEVDTEEEQEHIRELEEMSKEDEKLKVILEEYFEASNSFLVSWEEGVL